MLWWAICPANLFPLSWFRVKYVGFIVVCITLQWVMSLQDKPPYRYCPKLLANTFIFFKHICYYIMKNFHFPFPLTSLNLKKEQTAWNVLTLLQEIRLQYARPVAGQSVRNAYVNLNRVLPASKAALKYGIPLSNWLFQQRSKKCKRTWARLTGFFDWLLVWPL